MKILNIIDIAFVESYLQRYYTEHQIEGVFFKPDKRVIADRIAVIGPDYVLIQERYETGSGADFISLIKEKLKVGGLKSKIIFLCTTDQSKMQFEVREEFRDVLFVQQRNFAKELDTIITEGLQQEASMDQPREGQVSILYVDDSPMMHSFIKNSLSEDGYKIISAYNGDEGYELYLKTMPSLVITDYEMPIMNGIDLCKKIKQNNDDRYIPVIMLSAIDRPITIDTAFQCGIDDYLVKPASPEHLRDKVHEYIDNLEVKRNNKVLVVDDNKVIRELVFHGLRKNGLQVSVAGDGQEGWAKVQTEHPEIVITDIEMPIMGGYELCEKIKASPEYKDTIIIMMSTKDKPSDINRGQRLGVKKYFPKPFDVEKLTLYIEQLLLENYHIYKKEFEGMLAAMRSLIEALEKRDVYTRGHTDRVAEMSVRLGRRMGMNRDQLQHVELGANLHDIGKIGVRDNVLLKEGALSDEEYGEIKKHTTFGAEILSPIRSLQGAIPCILYHHERWDGKGYPEGLVGEAIPLSARIIAIVDTYDAMTSDRPYRKGMSSEQALEVIVKAAGTQFCPVCSSGFVSMMRELQG